MKFYNILLISVLFFYSCNKEVINEVVPEIKSNMNGLVTGQEVTYTDISEREAISRKWTFEGGSPETSTEISPVVTYSTSGKFDVTLEVKYESLYDVSTVKDTIEVVEPNFSKGLIAYYPFNGNANDESENENHGFVDGPLLDEDRFGNTNSCYSFDGNDDIIKVINTNYFNLNRGFTLSAWFYTKDIKTQTIFRDGSCLARDYPFSLGLSGTNYASFQINTNDENLHRSAFFGYKKNKWYLMTGVFENKKMTLYINGEIVDVTTIEGRILAFHPVLYIGTRLQLPSSTFNGRIDEIRIYKRALSDGEVLYLYEEDL